MGQLSRDRLQAVHVTSIQRSALKPASDAGAKGYQKKLLLQIAKISGTELRDLKSVYRSASSKTHIDIIITAVEDQFRDLDSHVSALSKIDSQLLQRIIENIIKRRESFVQKLAPLMQTVQKLISRKNKDLLNEPAFISLQWASRNSKMKEKIQNVINLAYALGVRLQKIKLENIVPMVIEAHHFTMLSVKSAQTILSSEPVGYLHLEKLEFTPGKTQRGELVYSVPLSPGEEVSITNREWSQQTEEFEKIITDYLEEYSEEGVTEKTELAEAVSSQTQHSVAFNTGLSVTGSYGSVTATATANLNIQNSANESANESRNKSVEMTHKASSRSKKDHKVSFRIASVSEKEQLRVQTIKNPSPTKAARVDYYQMIRAWNVRLFRYGIRLTWDIMVPEPASDLLQRIQELTEIKKRLQESFTEIFTLTPGQLTPGNYMTIASQYGVTVSTSPPPSERIISVTDHQNWASTGNGYTTSYTVDITLPEGYVVKNNVSINYTMDHKSGTWGILVDDISTYPSVRIYSRGSSWASTTHNNISTWQGKDGVLHIFVLAWDIKHWAMSVQVPCAVKPEFLNEWKMRAWEEIRQAVQTRYYEERQTLQTRLEELEGELAGEDALSLRRREREEIMKGVLRWMGVQGHEFYPSGLPEYLYGDSGSLYDPSTGLVSNISSGNELKAHGEKIRFLHQAIEWENVLYFLYPYFWIHPQRWQDKLYLDHPDPIHRAFLKAGSCRVVLTVRPGFEDAFLAFINTGDMTALPPSPYREISDEFKSYATTNYQGIPPANPIDNFRPLLTWQQRKAWEDIQQLIVLLERCNANRGSYPTQAEGLAILSAYTDPVIPNVPVNDPWGNAYVYRNPGAYHTFDLFSLGADGAEGGEGDDADISNWAEASLIGTWTEYTPTSALDIDFLEL